MPRPWLSTVALLTGLFAAGLTAPAGADPDHGGKSGHDGPRLMRFFETFDQNGDGRITREEARRFRAERFARFDRDGDGMLTLEEYRELWLDAMRRRMVRRFQMYDADGDGKITPEEFARPGEAMFWRMDRDGDGVITREEVRRGPWERREKKRRPREDRDD